VQDTHEFAKTLPVRVSRFRIDEPSGTLGRAPSDIL
jgi:hypothetical protein